MNFWFIPFLAAVLNQHNIFTSMASGSDEGPSSVSALLHSATW